MQIGFLHLSDLHLKTPNDRTIVLSKGFQERLQVTPETLLFLEQRQVRVHALQTEEVVKRYNELVESEPVGALIHSTC